jgi:hemerythrin
MDYIKWNDNFSVNIPSIDNQHKKLVEAINVFYNNLSKKRSKEVISDTLFQLKKYTDYHFKSEEELMKRFGFKGLTAHKKEHDLFIEKINEMQEKLNTGKLLLTIELANFLKDWLSHHVLNTDKEYSAFLVSNGVK